MRRRNIAMHEAHKLFTSHSLSRAAAQRSAEMSPRFTTNPSITNCRSSAGDSAITNASTRDVHESSTHRTRAPPRSHRSTPDFHTRSRISESPRAAARNCYLHLHVPRLATLRGRARARARANLRSARPLSTHYRPGDHLRIGARRGATCQCTGGTGLRCHRWRPILRRPHVAPSGDAKRGTMR